MLWSDLPSDIQMVEVWNRGNGRPKKLSVNNFEMCHRVRDLEYGSYFYGHKRNPWGRAIFLGPGG